MKGPRRVGANVFTRLSELNKAANFYAIALALCVGLAALAPMLGATAIKLMMFAPLVAVLAMMLIVTHDGRTREGWLSLGLHRPGLSGWGLALLVPLSVLGFAYACVWLSGIAVFAVPADVGSWPLYILDLLVSIVVVALMGGVGEEVGWRGYLLPRLMSLGVLPALLVSGFLHGVFHLPAMLWTPHYHTGADPALAVPLFLATLTMAGVCYGYLRLMTGSVWPAAIAHSAFNIFWDRLNAFTQSDSRLVLEYLAGESGVLTLSALTIAASVLAYRLAGKPAKTA
jgi:uncharacterized protein